MQFLVVLWSLCYLLDFIILLVQKLYYVCFYVYVIETVCCSVLLGCREFSWCTVANKSDYCFISSVLMWEKYQFIEEVWPTTLLVTQKCHSVLHQLHLLHNWASCGWYALYLHWSMNTKWVVTCRNWCVGGHSSLLRYYEVSTDIYFLIFQRQVVPVCSNSLLELTPSKFQ